MLLLAMVMDKYRELRFDLQFLTNWARQDLTEFGIQKNIEHQVVDGLT